MCVCRRPVGGGWEPNAHFSRVEFWIWQTVLMNVYVLSGCGEGCCVGPGVCLDVAPWVFFTGFCAARNRGQSVVE